MTTFTEGEVQARPGEVFKQAEDAPVVITQHGQPAFVILPKRIYDALAHGFEQAENTILGEKASAALSTQKLLGADQFAATLNEMIIHGER